MLKKITYYKLNNPYGQKYHLNIRSNIEKDFLNTQNKFIM